MKLKKVLAVLMASAMIMGMSVTTFAENGKPTQNDAKNVSSYITGVDSNATITAYQIIDAEYTDDGFTGYKWVAGEKAGDPVEFTGENSDEVVGLTNTYITNIASNKEVLNSLTQADARNDDLGVGTWLLVVDGTNLDKVYNPMIISVYYSVSGSNDTMNSGSVDASNNWTLETSGAYAKSSDIPVTKTANDNDGIGENDQVAVGDEVEFKITSEIPSYSAASTATFVVKDVIENGLSYVTGEDSIVDVQVLVGNQEVESSNYKVEMITENGKPGFSITFDETYLKGLADATTNRSLTITYEATVTDAAVTKVGQNNVTINYEHGSTTSTEYFYTVSFDGIAKKIGVGGDADGLAGATFTLYDTWTDANDDGVKQANELSGLEITSTTSEGDYDVDFTGLDPDKTYYLTETVAPDNYSINDTVYTIEFKNLTEAEKGTVKYDVYVDGVKKATVTYGQELQTPAMTIENTKLSSLPSTGGIGTTIFTVGGCVIMVTAAGLYFASRRKENK